MCPLPASGLCHVIPAAAAAASAGDDGDDDHTVSSMTPRTQMLSISMVAGTVCACCPPTRETQTHTHTLPLPEKPKNTMVQTIASRRLLLMAVQQQQQQHRERDHYCVISRAKHHSLNGVCVLNLKTASANCLLCPLPFIYVIENVLKCQWRIRCC